MFPQFDPSKMDPKALMELSRLIQTLPPDMITRMQTIMHNSMAGLDVRKDMDEFERNLPPGFREKLMGLMAGQMSAFSGMSPTPGFGGEQGPTISTQGGTISSEPMSATERPDVHHESAEPTNLNEARLTVLRAVADGRMTPEDAEKTLFGG